jgi:DNA helicase IV
MQYPEVTKESVQEYLTAAYARGWKLIGLREELADQSDLAGNEGDAKTVQVIMSARANSLRSALTIGSLCMGSIEKDREIFYIGRSHIDDENGNALVVDWRAPVSEPFYRATFSDPQNLRHRWRFVCEGSMLNDLIDEDFTNPESLVAASGIPDPLLAELGRTRTGQMRDIVATIQSEQDEVIRRPLQECVVVQGGPGTGKTAIGLHRAAFLLFENRLELMRDGVLVLGPNKMFLNYISQVLPALGETSAFQTTLSALLGFKGKGEERDDILSILGDARMASLIESALEVLVRKESQILHVQVRNRSIEVDAELLEQIKNQNLNGNGSWSSRRRSFREGVVHALFLQYGAKHSLEFEDFRRDIMTSGLNRELSRLWPSTSAESLVYRLLTNRKFLRDSSEGILTNEECEVVLAWRRGLPLGGISSYAEAVLIDEAKFQLSGSVEKFGHVILDEAQDRSAMELRAIGRRAKNGSLTILGDLAQGTSTAAVENWETAIGHLAPSRTSHVLELSLGYRVPKPIMDYANRVLERAAPGLKPTTSVRLNGKAPEFILTTRENIHSEVAKLCSALSAEFSLVAFIMPSSLRESVSNAIDDVGIPSQSNGVTEFGRGILALTPKESKGLEFDAVVVVEPGLILDEEPGGAKALYVALTRSVQNLTVLFTSPKSLELFKMNA